MPFDCLLHSITSSPSCQQKMSCCKNDTTCSKALFLLTSSPYVSPSRHLSIRSKYRHSRLVAPLFLRLNLRLNFPPKPAKPCAERVCALWLSAVRSEGRSSRTSVLQALNCTFYIAKALKTPELSQFRGFSFWYGLTQSGLTYTRLYGLNRG